MGVDTARTGAVIQVEPHITRVAERDCADPRDPLSSALIEAATHLYRDCGIDAWAVTNTNLADTNTNHVQNHLTDSVYGCKYYRSDAAYDIAIWNRLRIKAARERATRTSFIQSLQSTCGTTLTARVDHAHGCTPGATHDNTPQRTNGTASTRRQQHTAQWHQRSQNWPDHPSHTRTSEPRKTTSPETRIWS